jgi:hypothetical protein
MKITKLALAAIICLLFSQIASATNTLSLSCNGCRISYPSIVNLSVNLTADPPISGNVDVTLSVSGAASANPTLLSIPMTSTGAGKTVGYGTISLIPSAAGNVTVTASAADFPTATSAITFVAATGPAAPSNLRAAAVKCHQINLSWTDNSNNETGFLIQRNDGTGWVNVGNVGPNVTTFSNTLLKAGKTYAYTVKAFNANGESSFSNQAQATTGPANAAGRCK